MMGEAPRYLADIAALEDDKLAPFDRWEALRRLQSMESDALLSANLLPALTKLFESDQALVRHAALELAAAKGSPGGGGEAADQASRATRGLMKVLEAPKDRMDAHSRVLALNGISACATRDDFLCIETVVAATKHEDPELRKAAARCLGSLKGRGDDVGRSAPRLARKLQPLLQDIDSAVREQVVRSLASVSTWRDEGSVISIAMAATKDTSTSVRRAAEDCLVELFDEDSTWEADSRLHLDSIRTALAEINVVLDPGLQEVLGLTKVS
eukprot:CAMPEP_0174925938 /NCGR_PEP_ID=MMETSP1355-20121228/8245_1 /TAXON_ID=464990 /ORGANISM="Hemiselmis tepida, Strain CCMP443" /LENGTH=269 /DNA_ID=CAMNT_0016171905 /DNA_START=225 /DNA_END=1034 /DNA_ORIENTATION=+